MSTTHNAAPILQLRDTRVAYGAIEAVKGISLELARGELVSLIGANGAGKTTTLNAIAGTLGVACMVGYATGATYATRYASVFFAFFLLLAALGIDQLRSRPVVLIDGQTLFDMAEK